MRTTNTDKPSPIRSESQARLTILDIFVGVAAAAMFIAVTGAPDTGSDAATTELIANIYFIVTLSIFTSGATGLFLFARRWWRGVPTDFQPGHWLLCLIGVMYPVILFSLLCQHFVFTERHTRPIGLAVLQILLLWAYLTAGFLIPVRKWWRLALIPQMLIIVSMIILILTTKFDEQMALFLFEMVKPMLLVFDIVVLLVLLSWDTWTRNGPRDWLHWWGVGIALMTSPTVLLLDVANWMGWLR